MQNTQYYEIHIQPILHNDCHYDLPTGELAASSLEKETTSEYCDIVFHKCSQSSIQLQLISQFHPSYEPLHFVLLHFYGENGWSNGNCHAAGLRKTVTQ